MNKIEGVLFAIIAVLFIGGGTWLIHHNNTVIEQEKQLIAEYEAQKTVIKEIERPDRCDQVAGKMAWSNIHINKNYSDCWFDNFDYAGAGEDKRSIMWIVCPSEVNMPEILNSYKLNRVYKKRTDYIYEFECKWMEN